MQTASVFEKQTSESEREMIESIIKSLGEGILAVGEDGTILYANSEAEAILGFSREEMVGRKVSSLFFHNPENDDFTQTILDAVTDTNQPHHAVVTYRTADREKILSVKTSYLKKGSSPKGLTMVFGDISELYELRDSVKAMEQIRELNSQLEIRNQLISRTFGLFLSDEIVNRLLDTPDGLMLGGTKMDVTIMMSDLRGFTAMSERMDPANLIDMLNHYLGTMTEIIQRRRGTIIEFIGDGIMAIFGAPAVYEEHASCAAAAALEMQAAMEEVNAWNMERDYPPLEMGIGLDSGEVIIGNIGSEKRMKYGAVGSHVNLCGRIESYTVGGQILISPSLRERIGESLEIVSEMRVLPKGADTELVLSHVTGIGAPYNVYISRKAEEQETLPKPLPVLFYRIRDKHTEEKAGFGGIVSVSSSSAVLETAEKLDLYENIQIEAGGRLFSKVIERREDSFLLQYTSVPAGYEKWIRRAF